jgi:hypothetical protein
MRRTIITAALAAVALAGLTGCGASAAPSAAGCKAASEAVMAQAFSGRDVSNADKPAACEGFSDEQIQEMVGLGGIENVAADLDSKGCESDLGAQLDESGRLGETPASCLGTTSEELAAISDRIVQTAQIANAQ